MKSLLCILGILTTGAIQAQSVWVLNDRTRTPVPQVLIYNAQAVSVLTDIKGQASLSGFGEGDKVIFQHPSFEPVTYDKAVIPDTVYLRERVIHTEQVVISASKWEQDISEIPQDIIAIEADEFLFRNPSTAADLLSQSGEIFVQKSQLGGGSPSLRGFAANSVLLVFDGVRMNNAIFRSGNLQNVISIDPLALEGVEVLMGSGSVIYGSDALGGVMDFHSVDPEFTARDNTLFQPDFLLRYASASGEKTAHGSLQVSGRNWASFTSVSMNDFGDLRTGKSIDEEYPDYGKYPFRAGRDTDGTDIMLSSDPSLQEPTGYDAVSILQKLKFSVSDNVELTYSLYHNRTGDIPRFDRLITTNDNGEPVYAEWYYGPQKWTMHSLRTTVYGINSFFDQLRILPAYQRYEESRFDRRFGSDSRRSQQEKLDIGSLNIDADKRIGDNSHLYYGTEFTLNQVSSAAYRENVDSGLREPATSRYPDNGSTYSSAAAYISMARNIRPGLHLSAGIRYSHVWLEASTTDGDAAALGAREISLSNGSLNGNGGLTWKTGGGHRLGFQLSSGFRAPNVDDVGKVFELDGNDLVIPNPSLKPEKTYNAELSWTFSHNGLKLETTAFYTFLTDAIVRRRVAVEGADSIFYNGQYYRLYAQVNAAEADIYGVSLSGSYQFSGQFGLRGTLNYTTGAERNTSEPLRHTTPVFGSLNATWLISTVKLEAYAAFNGNRYREDIPSSEIDSKPYLYARHRSDPSLDGSPGWYTLNLRGSWQVTPSLLFQTSLENILDRHYRPYSSGISAPGRNIILSLRVTPRK